MAYFESTKITNIAGNVINPAEQQPLYTEVPPYDSSAPAIRTSPGSVDDQLVLLRRLLKMFESQAAADPQQRQRITLDAVTSGLALGAVTITSGTVTTVTTVSTVTSVTNIANLAGWNQQMFADPARTAYNTGIRAGLVFT